MAFGDILGTDAANSTNPGTGISCAGMTVAVGDLVVVAAGYAASQSSITSWSISDGLGNTYTALALGVAADGVCCFSAYSLITAAGNAVVASSHGTTTADEGIAVVRFEGPFTATPLDKNPTMLTDSTSPFDCPSSTTLSQADELIVGLLGSSKGQDVATSGLAATSPAILRKVSVSGTGANTAGSAISSWVVSATTAVAPQFTVTATAQGSHIGTVTFKKGTAAAALPFNQINWPPVKDVINYSVNTFGLNLNLFPFPFNQTDWSKPFRVPLIQPQPPLPLNINLFSPNKKSSMFLVF